MQNDTIRTTTAWWQLLIFTAGFVAPFSVAQATAPGATAPIQPPTDRCR